MAAKQTAPTAVPTPLAPAPVQAPSIGRVVHFVQGTRHVPAIIIDPAQNDGERTAQALFVMTVEFGSYTTFADYDPNGAPATWHWPEFVPSVAPPPAPQAEQ